MVAWASVALVAPLAVVAPSAALASAFGNGDGDEVVVVVDVDATGQLGFAGTVYLLAVGGGIVEILYVDIVVERSDKVHRRHVNGAAGGNCNGCFHLVDGTVARPQHMADCLAHRRRAPVDWIGADYAVGYIERLAGPGTHSPSLRSDRKLVADPKATRWLFLCHSSSPSRQSTCHWLRFHLTSWGTALVARKCPPRSRSTRRRWASPADLWSPL